LALVNQQLKKNVAWKKRLQKRHGLASVFVSCPVARQGDPKPLPFAILGQFLFPAGPCVCHIPEQWISRRHRIRLITRKARRAEQGANAICCLGPSSFALGRSRSAVIPRRCGRVSL